MPYAVTLPLDEDAAERVRRMWRALAAQAGDDDALTLGYCPHITMTILPETVPAGRLEQAVVAVASAWRAMTVTLAGLGVFPATPPVVWVAPVVTRDLLAWHELLFAGLGDWPFDPHYRPGAWVPHVTLSKAGGSTAGQAVDIVGAVWPGPISARLERIELVRFRPVDILRSQALL